LLQACEALAEAHVAGIVHRDLKPANIYLTQRADGSAVVKVLDFGISKVTAKGANEASMTKTSALMGSPLYMSPEQMRSTRDVDARSDIWALGIILFECSRAGPRSKPRRCPSFARVSWPSRLPTSAPYAQTLPPLWRR